MKFCWTCWFEIGWTSGLLLGNGLKMEARSCWFLKSEKYGSTNSSEKFKVPYL